MSTGIPPKPPRARGEPAAEPEQAPSVLQKRKMNPWNDAPKEMPNPVPVPKFDWNSEGE